MSDFPLFAVARSVVGLMFLYSAASKAVRWPATVEMMRKYRFPLVPLSLGVAICAELTGAVLLLAGNHLLAAGVGLCGYVLIATVMVYGQDALKAEGRALALTHIANNLMVIGGLLAIASL